MRTQRPAEYLVRASASQLLAACTPITAPSDGCVNRWTRVLSTADVTRLLGNISKATRLAAIARVGDAATVEPQTGAVKALAVIHPLVRQPEARAWGVRSPHEGASAYGAF
jgi:hypothetical protein